MEVGGLGAAGAPAPSHAVLVSNTERVTVTTQHPDLVVMTVWAVAK